MEGGAVTGNEVLARTVNHADNGRSPAEPPSRPRNRKVLRTLALVVLLVIAGVLAWANWATVSKIFHGGDGSDRIIRLSGRIEGDDSAVASKTSGRILDVRVREGDSVNAGQILAVLDDQHGSPKNGRPMRLPPPLAFNLPKISKCRTSAEKSEQAGVMDPIS